MRQKVSETARTACIILARGGSKTLPRKNLRKLGGITLVGRSVMAGQSARDVDLVAVSTDDAEIAAETTRYGATVIHRPAALATDISSSESGWLHAYHHLKTRHPALDRLVFLQCTSPFTTGDDIDGCLAAMVEKGADCALSVLPDHGFLWGYDDAGFGSAVNHDPAGTRQRRQDLPPQFRESGAIYCVNAEAFIRTRRRFCGSVALFPVNHPPVEIDTQDDFALCTQIVNAGPAPVGRAQLSKIKALIMDFDGVQTDTSVQEDEKTLSMLCSGAQRKLLILSKADTPAAMRWPDGFGGEVSSVIDDKLSALEVWLNENDLDWPDVLYVGHDVNDLLPIRMAGLSAAPSDSHLDVLREVDWVLPYPGVTGALRSLCDTFFTCPS